MTDDNRIIPLHAQTGTIPPRMMLEQSGFEQMQALIAGEVPPPPIARLMNMALTSVEEGKAVFQAIPGEEHFNPAGSVHGGWAAAVLDSALGCCVHTQIAAGYGYGTVEFKVNLVRPISEETGLCICEGRVVHFGRTIATSEATLKTASGKLLAHGTETCAIFPIRR